MISYLKGFLRYFFRLNVSKLSFLTGDSYVSSKAVVKRLCKLYKSRIEDFSYVAPHTELVCCNVGKYCSIAKNCKLGLAKHAINFLSTSPIFTEKKNALGMMWAYENVVNECFEPVNIGNDVWIGENVIVLGGVSIGDGAIVGAGAVVTKNVPPYAIVGGVPAKKIRDRFPNDVVNLLVGTQWWNIDEKKLKENISFFQKDLTMKNLSNFVVKLNQKD